MSAAIGLQKSPDSGGSPQLGIMTDADLAEVVAIESLIYPNPWTYGNFADSLRSGYQCWVLRDAHGELSGYFLMMLLVDEAHLLNISIRGDLHGRGFGRHLLDQVVQLAEAQRMTSILLEVRPSNPRALAVYERYGFVQIGMRRNYYPAATGRREDAIVMRLVL